MKKLIYSLLTLAAALSLASCQPDKLLGGKDGGDAATVDASFTVTLGPATKAFADGGTVDKLYAGIYEIGDDNGTPTYTHIWHTETPIDITSKTATVQAAGHLVRNHSYRIVFWAQKGGVHYGISWDPSPVITVTDYNSGSSNDETRDAFYGYYDALDVQSNVQINGNNSIKLRRPFAQINVLVPNGNINDASQPIKSTMTVAQAPTTLNLATAATGTPQNWSFSSSAIADKTAFTPYENSHKYAAMNYVLVTQDPAGANYNVVFTVTASGDTQESGDKGNAATPLKPNVRTNFKGDVFSNNYDIDITTIIDWTTAKVATPTFSPNGGNFNNAQTVTISCATTGNDVKIYYTDDGSNPTSASTEYTGAINVSSTTTLKAIAIKDGMTDSDVATATFTIAAQSPTQLVMSDITCSAQTAHSLTFSWTAVDNADGYEYSTDNTNFAAVSPGPLSQTLTGLEADHDYTIYVRAVGSGNYSTSESKSTLGHTTAGGGGPTPLSDPTGVVITQLTATEFTGKWTNDANATDYEWTVSTSSTYAGIEAGNTIASGDKSSNGVSLSEGTYTVALTGLTLSGEYYFYVKAIGDGNTYSDSDNATKKGAGYVFVNQAYLAANKDGSIGEINYTNSTDYGNNAVTELRVYKNAVLEFTAPSGTTITRIVLTCTANGTTKQGPGCFGAGAPNGYTFENNSNIGTWTGSASTVTFTATDNQVRITDIEVTYTK